MRVAVVHDGTVHPGGAVAVVTEAAAALDADLHVGFSGKPTAWWRSRVDGDVTVHRRVSEGGRLNDARTALDMLRLDLSGYDVVLTSGPTAKFVRPHDDQRHVHYLHHPPLAALWNDGSVLSYPITAVDRVETWAIPHVIANSELTAARAHAQYNREVDTVISPPVDVEAFAHDRDRTAGRLVMVGRLEERKRPSVAVSAMERLPEHTLVLVGDGPLREPLARRAPPNVEFAGYVDRDCLRHTVEESVAGLFLARREDFGVTPIEYMAAGTPVVGVDEPNTNNQVDDEVGTLVEPEPEAVAEGVRRVTGRTWDRGSLRARAGAYGADRFRDQLRSFVESKLLIDDGGERVAE